MSLRTRPIHCKFETLRLAGEHGRSAAVSAEQLSARFTGHAGRIARPASIFSEFRT